MTALIFIIVLAVLILAHELGHFIAAKSVGARVDEFGLGFPPRVWGWRPKGSETMYSLNWIPFGGFVKILGEDGDENADVSERSLARKPAWAQIWTLAAGVFFNVVLAWVLISIGFMSGLPMSVTPQTEGVIGTPVVTVLQVFPDTPAEAAGLTAGDEIIYFELPQSTDRMMNPTVDEVQTFIGQRAGEPFVLGYVRDGVETEVEIMPTDTGDGGRGAIGVALDYIGTVKLPWYSALFEGVRTTANVFVGTAEGLFAFLADAVRGDADVSQVAGPVGIAGLIGTAAKEGFIALISFAAFISLNLAVLNLLPFPALDGGRILFVIIEKIKGSPIPTKVAQTVNLIGFGILIVLMVVVTVHDIVKLF